MSKLFNYIGDLLSGSPEDYSEQTFELIESEDLGSSTEFTVPSNSSVSTGIKCSKYLSAQYQTFLNGPKIVPAGVIDPTNVSTGEANLINGNFTDLVYNNSSTGSANKELPAIDLGASPPLTGVVRVTWWTNASYTASEYKIQGSNDSTNWTDVVTGLSSTGRAGESIDIAVNSTFRYWRVFCVTGDNATYCVISEMEAFESGAQIMVSESSNEELTISCNSSEDIEIINNSSLDIDFKIYHNK